MTGLPGGPIGAARQAAAERELRAAGHCGQTDPSPLHSSHQFMRGGTVYRCPGGAAAQPGRHTADTITDDELDALYGELGLTKHLLANVRETCTTALNRAEKAECVAQSAARDTAKALADYLAAEQCAEQAEAAIERVRAFTDRLDDMANTTISTDDRSLYRALAADLHAALTEPEEPTP